MLDPYDILETVIREKGLQGNEEQEWAVRIVANHYISHNPEQLFLYITGVAGSGKSHVINTIVDVFKLCGNSQQVLLSTPTGCAAVLIHGYTIHALTFLPQSKWKYKKPELEAIWKEVQYLVIDEISMVSAKLLSQISNRIANARSWDTFNCSKPFGGINVIFTGDFGQLKPVKEKCLFSYSLVNDLTPDVALLSVGQTALHGALLWRQVKNVVELKKNWRAHTDLAFVDLLACIRNGSANKEPSGVHRSSSSSTTVSMSDYELLCQRRLQIIQAENESSLVAFNDAPIVVSQKKAHDAINFCMARRYATRSNQEFHIYHAKDMLNKVALPIQIQNPVWKLRSTITKEALGLLPLIPGMKVMVTENLAIIANIVNGSEGVLEQVKYTTDDSGKRFASCTYVHVPDSNIHIPNLNLNVIPIFPTPSHFTYKDLDKDLSIRITCSQIPLIPAYSYTDYKVQGRSLKQVIIDLVNCKSLQSVYVMLSRATSFVNLAILWWSPPLKLTRNFLKSFMLSLLVSMCLIQRLNFIIPMDKLRAWHRLPWMLMKVLSTKVCNIFSQWFHEILLKF